MVSALTHYAGMELDAVDLDNIVRGLPRMVIQQSDQLFNSSTTLVNSTELTMSLAAGRIYRVEFCLSAVGSTAGDIDIAWSVPSDATGLKFCRGPATSSTSRTDTTMDAQASNFATEVTYGVSSTTNGIAIVETGHITTDSAGTLILQFAQHASDAADTGIKNLSMLTVWEIVR